MGTIVGFCLFTEEKLVVQSDAKLIGSMVKTLVVVFDQWRYKEYLSSSYPCSKPTRCYRLVTTNKKDVAPYESETHIECVFDECYILHI